MNNTWEELSIGSDESGKGDFFGGPSIAAVNLTTSNLKTLKNKSWYTQIKDSKELSDDWIKQHIKEIKECIGSKNWALSDMSVEEYTEERIKHNENTNILLAAHHLKLHLKLSSHKDTRRIIDGFTNKENFWNYIDKSDIETNKNINIELITQSETKYLSVALASIIARYHFLIKIEEMSKESGVNIPLGNNYNKNNSVISAYRSLLEQGYSQEEINTRFIKSHFKTLDRIKKALRLR